MKLVDAMQCQYVEEALYEVGVEVVACHVEVLTTIAEAGLVVDGSVREFNMLVIVRVFVLCRSSFVPVIVR